MVTMLLRVFNGWMWFSILVCAAIAFHAWSEPARLLGETLIAAALWFGVDRGIKRSKQTIATVWNEP
jgi:hypothetical protein